MFPYWYSFNTWNLPKYIVLLTTIYQNLQTIQKYFIIAYISPWFYIIHCNRWEKYQLQFRLHTISLFERYKKTVPKKVHTPGRRFCLSDTHTSISNQLKGYYDLNFFMYQWVGFKQQTIRDNEMCGQSIGIPTQNNKYDDYRRNRYR